MAKSSASDIIVETNEIKDQREFDPNLSNTQNQKSQSSSSENKTEKQEEQEEVLKHEGAKSSGDDDVFRCYSPLPDNITEIVDNAIAAFYDSSQKN